jgi:hypothetical protein
MDRRCSINGEMGKAYRMLAWKRREETVRQVLKDNIKVITKKYGLKVWTEFGCIRLGSRNMVMVIKGAKFLDQLKYWYLLLSVELLSTHIEMWQSLL